MFMKPSRSVLIIVGNLSDESCTDSRYKRYDQSFFFRTFYRLLDNAEIYCGDGKATDDHNKAHALCMLYN